ncbi:hypothetical protein ACFU9Y_00890 [Streptomyces sp. NPDC057621]|uniref:hypothetical protein n=1 Tax=Streptomyces sp. NPDC057621 TaxID=3346186 RepID=UPI00367F3D8B
MSAAAPGRVGRCYTSARRHPWVLGKVADWKIPLGPYTPVQIAVAVGGGFLLVKTIGWWSWMGPVPIVALVLMVWVVRRPRIKGRGPMQAALGWALLAWQPQGGRMGGAAARDRIARPLVGGFTLEGTAPAVPVRATSGVEQPRAGRSAHRGPAVRPGALRHPERGGVCPVSVGPVSGVQQLLALAEQAGGAR